MTNEDLARWAMYHLRYRGPGSAQYPHEKAPRQDMYTGKRQETPAQAEARKKQNWAAFLAAYSNRPDWRTEAKQIASQIKPRQAEELDRILSILDKIGGGNLTEGPNRSDSERVQGLLEKARKLIAAVLNPVQGVNVDLPARPSAIDTHFRVG